MSAASHPRLHIVCLIMCGLRECASQTSPLFTIIEAEEGVTPRLKKLSLPKLPKISKKLPILVITGSILLLGISATIWIATRQTERLLANEPQTIQSHRSDLLEIQTLLLNITPPAKFYTGQGYVKTFTERLQQQIDDMPVIAPVQSPSHLPSFIPRSSPYWSRAKQVNSLLDDREIQTAYTAANRLPGDLRQLSVFHLGTFKAIAPVLDYNPENDFMEFDKNNPDTVERLKRAKDGIAKADEDARAISVTYSDPSFYEILMQLEEMQTALQTLENTGDTAAWKTDVEAAQKSILENRSKFWDRESAHILQTLQHTNQVFSSLESKLRLITAS